MNHELIVFVTTSTRDEASHIAEVLVSGQLAACVNIIPSLESIYRWEGKIARDHEALMIIKTSEERYADLERRIKELHSYGTPEVIAIKIEQGSADYLKWIRDSTKGDRQ